MRITHVGKLLHNCSNSVLGSQAPCMPWLGDFEKKLASLCCNTDKFLIRAVKTALLIFTEFISLFLSFLFLSFSTPTHNASVNLLAEPLDLGSQNLVWTCPWMVSGSTFKVKVIGQRSRSLGPKT